MTGIDDIISGILINLATGPVLNYLSRAYQKLRGAPLKRLITERAIKKAIDKTRRDMLAEIPKASQKDFEFTTRLIEIAQQRIDLALIPFEGKEPLETVNLFRKKVIDFFSIAWPDSTEEIAIHFADNLLQSILEVFKQEVLYDTPAFRKLLMTAFMEQGISQEETLQLLLGMERKIQQFEELMLPALSTIGETLETQSDRILALHRSVEDIKSLLVTPPPDIDGLEMLVNAATEIHKLEYFSKSQGFFDYVVDHLPPCPKSSRGLSLKARSVTFLADDLRNQGVLLGSVGAIKRYEEAQRLWEALKDWDSWVSVTQQEGVCYGMLGEQYGGSGYWDKALECYALALSKVNQTMEPISRSGHIFRDQVKPFMGKGNVREAWQLVQRSLRIFEKRQNRVVYGITLRKRGIVLENQGRYKEARRDLENGVELLEPDSYQLFRTLFMVEFANLYATQGERAGAIEFARMAEQLCIKYGFYHQLGKIGALWEKFE